MSETRLALVIFLAVAAFVVILATWVLWSKRKSRPAVRLHPPGNPIHRLEHECWPTQTVEWFGHDDRCATCGARRLGVPNHLDNPLWKPGPVLPEGWTIEQRPTRAEVDYWLTGLGTREQINAAGYEAVSVIELGSTETRYVKGRRIEGHRGQVEPRVAVHPTATPRAEQGGRPDWLPGDPV